MTTANDGSQVELYHEERGSGRPIIALHGFGATLYTWRHVAPALEGSRRLFLFDLKGHGRSPRPRDERYSLADQAELICDFIQAKDLRDLTLIGHSMGGGVALLCALKLKERGERRLQSLVLIASASFPQRLPLMIAGLKLPVVGPLTLTLTPPRLLYRLGLSVCFYDLRKVPADAVAAYAAGLAQPGSVYAITCAARQIVPADHGQIVDRIGAIDIPTCLVWGRQDSIVPLGVGVKLHDNIKTSELIVFDRCGHIPHEEMPEKAVPAIVDFIRRIEGGA